MSGVARFAVKSAIVAAVAAAATLLHAPTPAADAMAFAPAAAGTSTDQEAPEGVETLTVVPDTGVPYVLACRTESGPADGVFRWQSCVPDESPDGGQVVSIGEDGSASYSDGWTIAPVDESARGTVVGKWSEPTATAAAVRTVAHETPQPRPAAGSCHEPAPVPTSGAPSSTPAPAPTTAPRPLVNVNTASVAELDALPGIGDVLAARIVAQRPYSTVDDLRRVARIPAKVFPLVTV